MRRLLRRVAAALAALAAALAALASAAEASAADRARRFLFNETRPPAPVFYVFKGRIKGV